MKVWILWHTFPWGEENYIVDIFADEKSAIAERDRRDRESDEDWGMEHGVFSVEEHEVKGEADE